MKIIKSGIDITPYKVTTIGGRVASGKSFITGLLIDELLDIGKYICYIDIYGNGVPKFDISNNNARSFMFHKYENIIDFYKKINLQYKEVYVIVDGIGDISFQNTGYNNYKLFLQKIKEFKNIKSVVLYNYNTNNSTTPIFLINSDFHIDVRKELDGLYINDNYLCNIDELCLNPIRRKREVKISKILDK